MTIIYAPEAEAKAVAKADAEPGMNLSIEDIVSINRSIVKAYFIAALFL